MRFNNKTLEDRYDVIIIGAGIGGLTCGCYLAKAGMKVLIVEQHNKPGGCCSSFLRKGVHFDAAVHTLASCSEGELLGQVLDELDLRSKIKFTRLDPSDVIITKDYEIPIKVNWTENIEALCKRFPRERQNIQYFFDYIRSLDRENNYLYLKLGNQRFQEILQSYFHDKRLISLLGVLLLYTGVPYSEASALICTFAYKQLLDGGYYPVGGVQEFSDAFAQKFTEYGGTLLLSHKVEKIEIKDKEVKGCRLLSGEYIQAGYMVSNGDARQTYFKLIGTEHLSSEFVKKIDALLPTPSFFTVYLGLTKPLARNKRNGVIWYFPERDINEVFSEVFYGQEPYLREGVICVLDPVFKRTLTGNPLEVFYVSVTAHYKDSRFWQEHRESIADELIERAKGIFPELSSSIGTRVISTPYDIERFTLNYQGATNGWACTPEQVCAPVIKRNTRIKKFFMIGHWVNQSFGGGIAAVANIGRNTANFIKHTEEEARTMIRA